MFIRDSEMLAAGSRESKIKVWNISTETVAENYRKLIRDHTNPLVIDICRSDPRDGQEYEHLYRKIVLAMLLLSGVGDATKKEYIVAAEVALKSIFPQKNLEGFIHLSFHNKITELDDLKKTVTGIILYNEYKLNQSLTSNQQSTLLEEGSKVVLEKLSCLASCLDSLAAVITLSIQEIVHFDAVDETLIVVENSPFIGNNSGQTAKSYLLLVQHCRRFVRTLLEDARDCQQDFYRQEDDYQYHIRSLLNDLRGKVAISMGKVYVTYTIAMLEKSRRVRYEAGDKRKVILFVERYGNRAAEKEFNINAKIH